MELPIGLRTIIENKLANVNIKDLQKDAENISLTYRNNNGTGNKMLTKELEALSYAVTRMPATFGAVTTALKNTLILYNKTNYITSLLDVGAGTGTATWAANELISLNKITCLEREDVMINLGKYFMQESCNNEIKNAIWKKFDLTTDKLQEKADIVICSYVLNELDEAERKNALEKIWEATNKILLIIEPGTPKGFNEVKQIREILIKKGGYIIAPCPNNNKCPKTVDDWCSATCRISRTKEHKLLKSGYVSYEDEKFSYIAVSKEKIENTELSRILRHPIIETGKIILEVCTNEGIKQVIVTKKNKDLFKKAKKAKCGDKL